jgi:metal-sulfur cluster biosynthetic enzyme
MSIQPAEIGTSRLTGHVEEPQAAAPPAPLPAPLTPEQVEAVRREVVNTLHTVFDPEIPVNIYELGLIYGLDVQPSGALSVRMTLTSPACPVAGSLPGEVRAKLQGVPKVTDVQVAVVWEAAKLQLGIDD